jgi:Rod binding domain-containing protein
MGTGLTGGPIGLSPALIAGPAQPTAAELAKRSQIKQTAQDFEASFLSVMMQQMFTGISTDGPFGGGPGEEMFRSVLTDAMAKQVARSGGVGVAATVEREMLKLQGLN